MPAPLVLCLQDEPPGRQGFKVGLRMLKAAL
jgi:hypothetical protein